jgi:hypothetical protein
VKRKKKKEGIKVRECARRLINFPANSDEEPIKIDR